jgi:AcrR family transcriptional regulator
VTPAREALLDRCVAYLLEHGFSDLSLREIATGMGTSHRMLIYHFGGRERLLAGVVDRVEQRQREALVDLVAGTDDLAEVGRQFWRRLSDPALAPAERLFFEIYSHALYGRSWTDQFRATVVAAWARPLAEILIGRGYPPEDAHRRARLGIAATRGLLLDLLLTGDREVLDAASDLLSGLLTGPARGPACGPACGPRRDGAPAGPAAR